MQKIKFHIEECNNGWLLTINPTDGKNPIEQAQIMFKELKNIIPQEDNGLQQIYEQIASTPQNERLVFKQYSEMLAYLKLMADELGIVEPTVN